MTDESPKCLLHDEQARRKLARVIGEGERVRAGRLINERPLQSFAGEVAKLADYLPEGVVELDAVGGPFGVVEGNRGLVGGRIRADGDGLVERQGLARADERGAGRCDGEEVDEEVVAAAVAVAHFALGIPGGTRVSSALIEDPVNRRRAHAVVGIRGRDADDVLLVGVAVGPDGLWLIPLYDAGPTVGAAVEAELAAANASKEAVQKKKHLDKAAAYATLGELNRR